MFSARALTGLLVLAALAVPAGADAAQTPAPVRPAAAAAPASVLLDTAATVARSYWHAAPCAGRVRVAARRQILPGMGPATDAWVTFGSPFGANNLAAAAASYTRCTISLARWRWPTAASMLEDWDMLCTTMTHEMGHLLGRVHDAAPGSVMAPVFTDRSSVPRICRDTRPLRLSRRR